MLPGVILSDTQLITKFTGGKEVPLKPKGQVVVFVKSQVLGPAPFTVRDIQLEP
jgi:hypothetical protein